MADLIRRLEEYNKDWRTRAGSAVEVSDAIEEIKRKTKILNRYRAALVSIATNTCCDKCREAALVAQSVLSDPTGQGKP